MSAFVAPGHCFESTKKIVIKENQDSFNRKKKKRPFLFQFPKSSPRRVFGGCQRPRQRRSGKSGQSGGRSAQLGESAGVVREERIILYHTRSQHQTKIARTSICMCVCVCFFFSFMLYYPPFTNNTKNNCSTHHHHNHHQAIPTFIPVPNLHSLVQGGAWT